MTLQHLARVVATSGFGCLALLTPLPAAQVSDVEPVLIRGHAAHPTRVLARLRTGNSALVQTNVFAAHGLRAMRISTFVPGLVVLDDAVSGGPSAAAAVAPGAAAPAPAARLSARINALRATGLFAYVEPDYQVSIMGGPDDTAFADGTLWGLRNTGQDGGVAGVDIDATRAWEITTGSPEVIVAVIDTGIRYTHADLAAQMWQNTRELPANGVDDDGNGYVDDVFGFNAITDSGDPADDHDHGTHVAGTIGAAANDGHAHVGVAWNVRLMACKFLDSSGVGYTDDAITCIEYAAMHGARILSNSWGGGGYSQGLADAIAAAGARGGLFVAAAGNGGFDLVGDDTDLYPNYPGSYEIENVVAVTAIDRTGALAEFANFGIASADLGAPGVAVFSSVATTGKHGYRSFRGTSMATPHVSGVAALVLARFPQLDVAELKNVLVRTTTPLASLQGKTVSGGMVNAFQAVTATPDHGLEIALTPANGAQVFAPRDFPVFARVTDLHEFAGATVTGAVDGGVSLVFHDDGVAPDQTANDGVHAATLALVVGRDDVTVRVRAEAPGYVAAETTATWTVVTPPDNDAFAAARELTDRIIFTHGTNFGAGKEAGEPDHAGQRGSASVWWAWTAPADCIVTITTTESAIDTLLAVYTGDAVSALALVAANDDDPYLFARSKLEFPAIAGTRYAIAVDGRDGQTGAIQLDVSTSLPPFNDAFADRVLLTGERLTSVSTMVGATNEPGEPLHPIEEILQRGSIWWTWVAPSSGTASLYVTARGANTILAVYSGDTLEDLVLAPNVDRAPFRPYAFRAVAGTTYQIQAYERWSEYDAPSTIVTLDLRLVPPPPNDMFADPIEITGFSGRVTGSTAGATLQEEEPFFDAFAFGSTTVWWTWTAPEDRVTVVSTAESPILTQLTIYTGGAIGALDRVGQAGYWYEQSRRPTRVVFQARAGVRYLFQVSGFIAYEGDVVLQLDSLPPPPNDDFVNRVPLTGAVVETTGSNRGAWMEFWGEPIPYDAPGRTSVWWSWTAPANGRAFLSTGGSAIATDIGVFAGATLDALEAVRDSPAAPPAIGHDAVSFYTTAGTAYQIKVGGQDEAMGDLQLAIRLVDSPPNDRFADRLALVNGSATVLGTNHGAGVEESEPIHAGQYGAPSVWWTWTASAAGRVTISATSREAFASAVSIYTGMTPDGLTLLAGSTLEVPARRAVFSAEAGVAYQIAVIGEGGTTGAFQLELFAAAVPANDQFVDRLTLAGESAHVVATNRGSSPESGEPAHAFVPAEESVWWTWTAPAAADVEVNTAGSDFDTVLGIYAGTTLTDLRWIAWNDDAPQLAAASRVRFVATAGATYQIAVAGYEGATGALALQLTADIFEPPVVELVSPVVVAGSEGWLTTRVTGVGPFTYQWQRDGSDVPGATGATYRIPSVQQFLRGSYAVVVRDAHGLSTTVAATITVHEPSASRARLTNLSTRALALTGDEVMITGFVIAGSGPKRLLLRAVGPTLGTLGLSGVLPDPQLTLKRWNGAGYDDVTSNNNWGANANAAEIRAAATALFAFPLAAGSADAALLVDLAPGQYSVVADDVATRTGLAIVELYDADPSTGWPPAGGGARLTNLSTRGYVGTGDAIMISGLVVSAEGPMTLLIRVVGPTLGSAPHDVSGVLADPTITIYRHDSLNHTDELILTNDDWSVGPGAPRTREVTAQVFAFALAEGSQDAAFVVTLTPGVHTVHVRGAEGATGVALVEVYVVP